MHINNRLFIAAVLALLGVGTAVAIPADPQPKQVRQADGTVVTVYMRGDEFWHQMFTADGRAVSWNPLTQMLEPDRRTPADYDRAMSRRAEAQRRYARPANANAARSSGPRKLRINDFPTTGQSRSLVVLLEFSDTRFSSIDDPKDYYQRMLNERGFTWSNGACGSAMDFYDLSSNYRFDHEFVVVGPVTLDHEATYYGSDKPSQDARAGEMVVEACRKIDDEVDFSTFDYDGDGYVDNIYFFYAGIGQATHPNATDYIWPHSADLDTDWDLTAEHDGKKIRHYATSNELRYTADGALIPLGIGVFVHEFGHVLGLTDHYDVGYNLLTFNVSSWDTMAQGSYNNNMNNPPLFSAFERGELGWLDYEELTVGADSVCLLPPLSVPIGARTAPKAYRWSVPGTEGREFFVMENRQQVGFDEYLPGHGLLAWHIDIDTTAWMRNAINVDYTHQRVAIVCADGIQSDATRTGDPFPGAADVRAFTFNDWSGRRQFALDDVNETGTQVDFLLAGTAYRPAKPEPPRVVSVEDSAMVFTWSPTADATSYLLTVSHDGTALSDFDEAFYEEPEVVSLSGLSDQTDYDVTLVACRGSYRSEPATLRVTTLETVFAKRRPTGLSATDISADGFTARWQPVSDADDYLVSLYRNDYGSTLTDMGYDFSGKADGLPQLWATSSSTYYSVSGYYGQASPALRFSRNDDYIEIAFPEARIRQLRFWVRSSTATGLLHAEQYADGQWLTVSTFEPPTTAATLVANFDDAERIRLRYERTSGYITIDDIVAACITQERQPVDGQQELSTGGATAYTFSQLADGQYSFRVCALSQGSRSAWSDECQVGVEHSDTIRLGYANGEVAATTDLQMNGTGWAHVAMRLPDTSLSAYAGNRLEAVSVYLLSRANIDSLRVWVRESLDGPDLAAGLITSKSAQRVEKGWNEVRLAEPLDIAGTTLYVGFSYRQRANVKAVSVVGEPLYDAFYLRYGQAGWTDISQMGAVSMEAVIAGSHILSHDLGLAAAAMSPALTTGPNALLVEATVQNFGSRDVDGFDITCQTAGIDPITVHFDTALRSTESRRLQFTINPPVYTDQDNLWTLTLGDDDNTANNSAEATYAFLKNVLVEEFTTEQCVNCPRVATFMHLALESKPLYGERVFAVCHHAGYYTDWLTQPWDEPLTWLYNEGTSLYAPAVMINRHPEFDAQYNNGARTPCFIPASSTELAGYFDYELQTTANAAVGLTLDYNADSTALTAHVSLLRNARYRAASPRLTLYLVEDDIRAKNQIGADGVYWHQHVTRATNQTWGEPVEWTADNRFSYDYTFDIDPEWERQHMQVVAVLHNYDGEDHTAIDVENAARTRLTDVATDAIHSTSATTPATRQAYDLQGRPATTRSHAQQRGGLYIVRQPDGTIKKMGSARITVGD